MARFQIDFTAVWPERSYKKMLTSGGLDSVSVGKGRLLIWAAGILEAWEGLMSPPSIASGFFFFNLANIEDSRSGNGGISSSTVAYSNQSSHSSLSAPQWSTFPKFVANEC